VKTRGLSRAQLQKIADWSADEELEQLATSDVWWDEIVSIEPAGEEETYDLTIPVHHNFVADDLIVHNSALVTNIAENAAIDHGLPVALFSLEMSETELAQRFVASQARIKGDELRKGRVPDGKWPKILQAAKKLAAAPLFIDDYLQLMRPDGRVESRVQQVGEMSRGLKILARELNVPVIALSQLSRAVETRGQSIDSKRPLLSDLRESGSIEQDADLVAFIFREEYYDKETERAGIADIIIAKHRNGAIGDVELTFAKEYPKFLNYTSPDRYA
jgi:replicative DNA helicase